MRQRLLANRSLIILLAVSIAIKLFSLNEVWVERWYSTGVYPVISRTLRLLFGWLPFSIGDLAYIAAGIWLVVKAWRLVKRLKRRGNKGSVWMVVSKYLRLTLVIYIVFSLGWGMNYNRLGVEQQFGLRVESYSHQELYKLTAILRERLRNAAGRIDSVQRLQYNQNHFLVERGEEAYRTISQQYHFLSYSASSIKPSLLTPIGKLFGFTGYYNPFSGEAQVKTDIPVFLKPYVLMHEIAHQLGYAKENEANFIAYIGCKSSVDIDFVYSAYFELYRDAIVEYSSIAPKELMEQWRMDFIPRFSADIQELHRYFLKNKNFIEPFMSGAYDNYLKLNNQPKGRATYSEVIAYLIAYAKRYGWEAL